MLRAGLGLEPGVGAGSAGKREDGEEVAALREALKRSGTDRWRDTRGQSLPTLGLEWDGMLPFGRE